MEMFENINEVVANIGRTALFGFCASLPLDVITAWNDKKKPSPQRLFVIDFAYCLFVALAFFVTLLVFAEGRLRVIWFVSAFVGVLVYRWLIGSLIRRTSEKVISWITAVSLFVRKSFFAPIGRFLKKIIV